MKKTVNLSFFYAILAMISGIFYREFTKFLDFKAPTTLVFVHTHLFMLGMIMMLVVTFIIKSFKIQDTKKFKYFIWIYNLGVLITSFMLLVRGIIETSQITLNSSANAMISGFSGIGHILTATGMIILFIMLKEKIN